MASTPKVQSIMTQPINLIFRFLQSKACILTWLLEQKDLRIEGRIIGLEEWSSIMLRKSTSRKILGNHWVSKTCIPGKLFPHHMN